MLFFACSEATKVKGLETQHYQPRPAGIKTQVFLACLRSNKIDLDHGKSPYHLVSRMDTLKAQLKAVKVDGELLKANEWHDIMRDRLLGENP